LVCEIRTEHSDTTDGEVAFAANSVYLKFIPPTGIPLTYVAGKTGIFTLNFDAALFTPPNPKNPAFVPILMIFDLATDRLK
jgi:hypothetical protein